jgi:hypothetical protein
MHVSLRTRPLHELKHNCWQRLFGSCVVVESNGSNNKPEQFGRGLKVSFELLIQLAAVQYLVYADGGFVLVGYSTALVPTDVKGNCVQFHLEVSESGRINPYKLKSARRYWVKDPDQFKTMRCFVGWCRCVCINLGTRALTPNVMYSGADERGATIQLARCTIGLQALQVVPLPFGILAQVNFANNSNRLKFTPHSEFFKMLEDTSKQLAIVCDTENRCSWLVPKLSLLLHMSHAWVSNMASARWPDSIPYVEPHSDGGVVAKALAAYGNIIVCGQGGDALTFQKLLSRLDIILQKSMGVVNDNGGANGGTSIRAFELMDIIIERGNGCIMKEVPIRSHWLRIVNDVDAVVVCSGLGLAITAADNGVQSCPRCSSLPDGSYYLVAPLSCLAQLSIRQGCKPSDILEKGRAKVSSSGSLILSGDPFRRCPHDDKRNTNFWKRSDIQRINRQSPLSIFGLGRGSISAVQNIPPQGAVILD